MKILKYILLFIVLIFVAGYFWVNNQPDAYDVKKSKLIKAPSSVIFNNVNDFKNWEEWGPWYDEDSTIVATYNAKTSGEGASYSWTSKDGPGNMKTLAIVENKSINQELQFADYEPSQTNWMFEETEEGTNVTWQMKADKIPFIFKFFGAISGGMDKMLGPMLANGLNNLDREIQEEMIKNPPKPKATYRATDAITKNNPQQNFIGYAIKGKISEMTKDFQNYMPKAGMYMAQHNLVGKSTPGAIYLKWDMENDAAEYYIGLFTEDEVAPKEEMKKVTIPASKVVMVSKFGPFGEGDYEVHANIEKHMEANKLESNDFVWELYPTDPSTVKPSEIQTDIYYGIK